MEICTEWKVRRCLHYQPRKTSRQTVRWSVLPIPLPIPLAFASSSTILALSPRQLEAILPCLPLPTASSAEADTFAVTAAAFTAEGNENRWPNHFTPFSGWPSTLLSDNGSKFCAPFSAVVYKTPWCPINVERVRITLAGTVESNASSPTWQRY